MGRPRKKREGVDPQGWKAPEEQTEARVNTHGPHGSESKVVLPEPSHPDPIVLPEPGEAVRLLEALALQNDRVAAARKRFEESQATTKARKSTWESEAKTLEFMLTEATHAKPMPLFDQAQAEADLAQMEQAAATLPLEGATEAAGPAQDAFAVTPTTPESFAAPIVAPEPSEAVLEEQIPF